MAGTNWGAYNLPAIWQMLQGENVCTGADRVLSWEGLATSVREQHRRMVKAGDDLAAVWPPEKNESAYVFLAEVEKLAASMQETLTCAENTRVGLRGVMEAIGVAQSTVRTLAAGRAQVSEDWVPRFIDHAEDEYDARAQLAMRDAEAAIADHSPQITAPALYSLGGGRGDTTTSLPDDGDGSSTAVRATPVPVAVPHDPVLPDLGIGLGLSGVTAPPAAPVPGSGATVGPPAGPGPGGGGISGGPGPLGLVPGAGGPGGFGAGFGVPGGRVAAPGGRQAVPMRRGLPSGAVIGDGELGGGRSRGGQPGQPPLAAQGGPRGRRDDTSDSSIGGKADRRWEVLDGVAPVIAPVTTPGWHDPGPGVLGFDR
jgi:hypothetical protein